MRRLPLLLTAVLLLATTACGGSDQKKDDTDSISGLHVGGSFGSQPTLRFDKPVKVSEVHTDVIEKGDGDEVKQGGKALLNMYIANGKTGKKAVSTYDQGQPLNATMDEAQFFPPLVKVLDGPDGTKIDPPKNLPGIVSKSGTIQGFDFAKAPKQPGKKLRVVQLVKGT